MNEELEGQPLFLRIIQSWSDSILLSLLNNFKREDIFENQLISQRQLFFWKLRVFQKSLFLEESGREWLSHDLNVTPVIDAWALRF